MRTFKDLKIETKQKNFSGKKIEVEEVLNREIEVHAYKIGDSKYERGSGKCMTLQICPEGVKRVVFTGSINLMDMIGQVQPADFPFMTVIKKEEKRLSFT